jgi:hypothetical protein
MRHSFSSICLMKLVPQSKSPPQAMHSRVWRQGCFWIEVRRCSLAQIVGSCYQFDVLISGNMSFEFNGAESAHDVIRVIGIVFFDLNLVLKVFLKGFEVKVAELAILVFRVPNLVAQHGSLARESPVAGWKRAGHRFRHDARGDVGLGEVKEYMAGWDEGERLKKKCGQRWLLWVEGRLKPFRVTIHVMQIMESRLSTGLNTRHYGRHVNLVNSSKNTCLV